MRLGPTALVLGVSTLLLSGQVLAGATSLGASFGVGYLPMADVHDFGGEYYEADPVGLYAEVFARIQLGHRHGLSLGVERLSKSASAESPQSRINWDFEAIPIDLSYEFAVRDWTAGTTPFFGLGVGVYHSRVEGKVSSIYFPPADGERTGWGYGLHGYLGQRVALSRSVAVSAKLRARWADGMYFTDNVGSIRIELTGVDFTAGAEWLF